MKVATTPRGWSLAELWHPDLLGDQVRDTVLHLQLAVDGEQRLGLHELGKYRRKWLVQETCVILGL